jgi:hypothetical protein
VCVCAAIFNVLNRSFYIAFDALFFFLALQMMTIFNFFFLVLFVFFFYALQMMTIFNSFVGIATLLDLGYMYLGPPMATDNKIIEIHKSLG